MSVTKIFVGIDIVYKHLRLNKLEIKDFNKKYTNFANSKKKLDN
jgi:hypothetical protein